MRLRSLAKQGYLAAYRLGLRAGFHVIPRHFYAGLPDVLELERIGDRWMRPSAMPGVALDAKRQLAWLQAAIAPVAEELVGNPHFVRATGEGMGLGYGYIEAQVLYAIIRHVQPAKVLEVGSGVTSYVTTQALMRNPAPGELVCIEPYPRPALRSLNGATVLATPVQEVPMETFTALEQNDVLFIDSTHSVHAGSDVNYLVLEVLPRLRSGVVVHIHDINFPYDYQANLLETVYHWSESSLVHAFLIGNARVRIAACLSYLHHTQQEALRSLLPEYDPAPMPHGLRTGTAHHFPSSLWLVTQ